MQLQFAGNRDDVTAPHVVKAWIADADLSLLEENPNDAPVPVVEPAVLLTKLQLSMLRKQVKLIIDVAEEAFLRSDEDGSFNFYDQLVSAAAQMSRDPSAFTDSPGANLEKKGVLDEVLEGLPYKSQVLRFKRDDWSNMSVGQQREFIKRLKGLIALYDEYDSDTKHWESFGTTLRRERDSRFVLEIRSLSLDNGEYVAITGPSGCGKSTTLDILGMILRPSILQTYEYCFANKSINVGDLWGNYDDDSLAVLRKKYIGYVLQTGELLPFLNLSENIELCAELADRKNSERLSELMDILHIAHLAKLMKPKL